MIQKSRRAWAKLVRSISVPYSSNELQLLNPIVRLHCERLEERYLLSGNPPGIADLRLLRDTGTPGDNVTSDVTVTGRVTNDGPASVLPVEFDINLDGAADGTVHSSADSAATFVIDLSNHVFAPGPVVVRVRAGELAEDGFSYAYGAWSTLSFTFSTPSASGDEHQHVLPASVSNATFNAPRLDQPVGPPALGPANFDGGSIQGGVFSSFGSRFSDQGNNCWSDGGSDSDDYYNSDSLGTYHFVTSYTYSTHFCSSSSGGNYNFSEDLTESYSAITTFSGYDGSSWWRSQSGSHSYYLSGYGYPNASYYSANEYRADVYSFSWSDVSTPNHNKSYGGSGEQYSFFAASGSSITDEYGGSTSEDMSYDAYGSDSYSDGGSDSIGSGANYSYSGKGNSGQAYWQYSSNTASDSSSGVYVASTSFSYDRDSVDGWSETAINKSDTNSSSGGISNHTVSQSTTTMSGLKQTFLHLDGSDDINGSSTSLVVNRSYNETINDQYNTTASKTSDITDNSVAKVNVVSHLTNSSAANRTRDFYQSYSGTTTVTNSGYSYSDYTSGSNKLKSDWTASATAHVIGTDTTVSGTTRTMISDRTTGDSGTSDHTFTSSGTESRNQLGVISRTGSSNTTSNLTGKSNFNSTDSSTVNSTSTTTSNGGKASNTTTTVGSDSSSNVGTGSYTANATGTASFNTNGTIATQGTSSHSASVNGTMTETHNYTTTVAESGSPSDGITRSGTSISTLQSNGNSTFTTTASGSATYTNASHKTSESESRNETGTSSSASTQDDEFDESDNRPGVPQTDTHVTSHSEQYASGTTSFATSRSVTDENGVQSYSDSQTESDVASTYTFTSTDTTADVTDNTQAKITTTGHSTSHSETNTYGDFSESLSQSSKSEPGGYSSTRTHTLSDSGSYDGFETSTSSSHSVDNLTDGITVDFTSGSNTTSNSFGFYGKSNSQSETTPAGGTYKSVTLIAETTDEGGDTVTNHNSTTNVDGVDSSPDVTTTVHSTSTTSGTDTGTFTAYVSHNVSTTIENGKTFIASADVNDRTEDGTATWSSNSNGSSVTNDNSTKYVSIYSSSSGGSNETGNGGYLIVDHFDTASITGIGTTYNQTHSRSTSGTTNWSNSGGSYSTINDISTPHVVRNSSTSTNSGGNGTGSYSTLDTDESHVHLLSSNSSTFSSRDTDYTGYSYFSIYSSGNEVQNTPATPGSSTQTTIQGTSNSSLSRNGNGTTSGSTHYEISTANGQFVYSLDTSENTDNGTLYESQTQNSEGTVNQDVYDDSDLVSTSTNHYTYNSSIYGNGNSHYSNLSIAESFGGGGSYFFSSSAYNGSGTSHTELSSGSDGSQTNFDPYGGVVDIQMTSSASSSSDGGYSDGSYDEAETLLNGTSSEYSSAWGGEGGKFTRQTSSTTTATSDSTVGGTHHSTNVASRSESTSGTTGAYHFNESGSSSTGSSFYNSTESSNEQGKLTWADSQQTNGTFDDNNDGTRHATNSFSFSENGNGTYSISEISKISNGKMYSKSTQQQSSTSTFQSTESASGTFHKTFTAEDGSVRELNASESESSSVTGGQASNTSSYSRENFEDGTWTEITGSTNSESANLTSGSTSSTSVHVDYPTGTYDGTKTADSSSNSTVSGSGSYSSADTYTKTETKTGWTSTSTADHSENDNSSWNTTNTSSSTIDKESLSGVQYHATSHDNSTDSGSGSNSYAYNYVTNASNSSSTTTGSSTTSISVSGNNTWDRGSDTSSSVTTPYIWGNCERTSSSTSHTHDQGTGQYSVSGSVHRAVDAGGTTHSGSLTRSTSGAGDTASTKTRTWTDTCETETRTSEYSDSITAGNVTDYTTTSQDDVTVNPDGTVTSTSSSTREEHKYAVREHENSYNWEEEGIGSDGLTHTWTHDETSQDSTKAGVNYNSDTGLTDHFYSESRSSSVTDTDSTENTTITTTTETEYSETRNRSDDEFGFIVSYSYTSSDSYDYDKLKTYSYESYGENSSSSGNSTEHWYENRTRDVTFDSGSGGTIATSKTEGYEYTSHSEWSSSSGEYGDPYGSSSSGYSDYSSEWEANTTKGFDINPDNSTVMTDYSYSYHSEYDSHSYSTSTSWNPYGSSTSSSESWADGYHDIDESLSGTTVHHEEYWHDNSCSDNGSGKICDPPDDPPPYIDDWEININNVEWFGAVGGNWYNLLVDAMNQVGLWADGVVDAIHADLQDLLTVLINPGAYLDGVVADVYQFFIDGSAADTFFGFVDGLASVVPFHEYFIPTIGAKYGHQDLYQVGNIVGTVVGIAASVLIGNVAAGGLVGCGTFLQKAAQVYNVLDAASGIISAADHVMSGTAGFGDALAFLPALSFGASKMSGLGGCFVAGTLVVVEGEVVPLTAGVTVAEEDARRRRVSWTLLGAAAGACFIGVLGYRRLRRKRKSAEAENSKALPRPIRLLPAADDEGVLIGARERLRRVPWKEPERRSPQWDTPFSTASHSRVASLFEQVPCDNN